MLVFQGVKPSVCTVCCEERKEMIWKLNCICLGFMSEDGGDRSLCESDYRAACELPPFFLFLCIMSVFVWLAGQAEHENSNKLIFILLIKTNLNFLFFCCFKLLLSKFRSLQPTRSRHETHTEERITVNEQLCASLLIQLRYFQHCDRWAVHSASAAYLSHQCDMKNVNFFRAQDNEQMLHWLQFKPLIDKYEVFFFFFFQGYYFWTGMKKFLEWAGVLWSHLIRQSFVTQQKAQRSFVSDLHCKYIIAGVACLNAGTCMTAELIVNMIQAWRLIGPSYSVSAPVWHSADKILYCVKCKQSNQKFSDPVAASRSHKDMFDIWDWHLQHHWRRCTSKSI